MPLKSWELKGSRRMGYRGKADLDSANMHLRLIGSCPASRCPVLLSGSALDGCNAALSGLTTPRTAYSENCIPALVVALMVGSREWYWRHRYCTPCRQNWRLRAMGSRGSDIGDFEIEHHRLGRLEYAGFAVPYPHYCFVGRELGQVVHSLSSLAACAVERTLTGPYQARWNQIQEQKLRSEI
jgi:hypothetical protein